MSRAEARGGRASGRGRAVRSHGRCALSRQLALRPGGSAHRCSTESPSSRRRAAQLIGDDRAGRAHPHELPHSGTCRRTAARLRGRCARPAPPNAMAQPVTTKKRSGDVAAGGSGGRRGSAGPDAPLATRHFAVIVGTGWPKGTRCQLRKLRGARARSYLGEFSSKAGATPGGRLKCSPAAARPPPPPPPPHHLRRLTIRLSHRSSSGGPHGLHTCRLRPHRWGGRHFQRTARLGRGEQPGLTNKWLFAVSAVQCEAQSGL